jgi:hypothetical protein
MDAAPPARKSSLLIDWMHAIAAAFVAVLLVWADFLETSTKTSRGGEDAIYHLLAPLQGPRLPGEPIVVVTVSRDDLNAINEVKRRLDYPDSMELPASETWTWPLDGYKHAEIAQKLEEYRPRAVFYDINFAQKRDGIADFAGGLSQLAGDASSSNDCKLANGARPRTGVFLSFERGSPPLTDLCNKGVQAAVTGWVGQKPYYPLYQIWLDCPEGACATTESNRPRRFEISDLQIRKTAAYALYDLWCRDLSAKSFGAQCMRLIEQTEREVASVAKEHLRMVNAIAPSLAAASTEPGRRVKLIKDIERPSYLPAPLSLQWGIGVSPRQSEFTTMSEADCPVTEDDGFDRLGTFFSRAANAVLATVKLADPDQTRFRCA